jgi:virulence factor Mce-like protein
MRQRGSSLAGNPVLIGAVTVLVVLVAVFLAYNANAGLPFVPTYELRVQVPSAAELTKGNDVRVGGARVGAISDIGVRAMPDGRNVATLTLQLDKAIDPLPRDSTVLIRPRSLLGQKYVEITPGSSDQGFASGDLVPLSAATPRPVEFDELINTFDKPTRDAIVANTIGFGTALAGRGGSLNQTFAALRPLVTDLEPVARTLADRRTGLSRLIGALGATAAEVAPVAEEQVQLFAGGERTFRAFADESQALKDTIAETPPTLDTAIRSFPRQRPFLEHTTALFGELRPGVRALRGAAPELAAALRIGTATLPRTIPFNRRLTALLVSLQDFAEDPHVSAGLTSLTTGLRVLRPTLDFVAPMQTRCNYLALLVRNASDLLSVGDANGNWQRFSIVATPVGPDSESRPSSGPANGPAVENHLHADPYPNTASPGQPRECEAGNEPYPPGKTVVGNVPGRQQSTTERIK